MRDADRRLPRRPGEDHEDETTIDGEVFEWGPRDVFVIPSWKQYSHKADDQSVLFSISDRPMQESLGIWREVN